MCLFSIEYWPLANQLTAVTIASDTTATCDTPPMPLDTSGTQSYVQIVSAPANATLATV